MVCMCDLIASVEDLDIFLDHLHVYQFEEVFVVHPPKLGNNVDVKGDTSDEVTCESDYVNEEIANDGEGYMNVQNPNVNEEI